MTMVITTKVVTSSGKCSKGKKSKKDADKCSNLDSFGFITAFKNVFSAAVDVSLHNTGDFARKTSSPSTRVWQ